ncbi:MAG: hypothetical protein ACI8YI_000987 [Paracoccaceae bacterium]|jgi:hypothetical protein
MIMNFTKTFLFANLVAISSVPSASAQVVPIETVAGYEIARVVSADVCFAVTDLKSTQNFDMVFSYYRAKSGHRWQVGGYLSPLDHPEASDILTVTFDGDLKIKRAVEFRDGDFILPFEALQELMAYELDVEQGTTLVLGLNEDSLEINLKNFRAAILATLNCVEKIE